MLAFLLLSMQRGLSATYPAPISTIFETTYVNQFPHPYTGENFGISVQGVYHVPKTAEMGTVDGGVLVIKLQLKRQNFGR